MDLLNLSEENDIFKRFLLILIFNKSFEKNSFFHIEQVKELEKIKIKYIPVTNIKFRGSSYKGVKIVFKNLFKKDSGIRNKVLTFYFPFVGGTTKTKRSNISTLMASLGCKGIADKYLTIRFVLEQLIIGKSIREIPNKKKVFINLSTPMFNDMANGRLVYRYGRIECGK